MKKLIIDAGNTFTKYAVFEKDHIEFKIEEGAPSDAVIHDIVNSFDLESVIISDVRGVSENILNKLPSHLPAYVLTSTTPIPLKLEYKSISSLGTDRIAAAVFGSQVFPDNDVLIIQTGTCITFDLVTTEKKYIGGGISPGLDMRFKALNTFTSKLPLVKKKEINYLVGESTQDSILSGVINGSIAEIDGTIDQYQKLYPGIKIVMGGGDTFFFDKKLKNRIFAHENLVLKGLNLILEYNVNLKK